MKIEVWLYQTSQPLVFDAATNAYTKGSLYCVYEKDKNKTTKIPTEHIFRIVEDYTQ